MAQGNAHSNPFLIAALGASADGLEAFERFFEHVPAETGIAFVIVQHLAPDHANALPELLARYTSMAVEQARDRAKIAPNRVYIIPPNATLTIKVCTLQVAAPVKARGFRTPIDIRRNAAPVYGAFRFATMVSVSKRSTWRVSRQRYWPGDLPKSGGALWRPNCGRNPNMGSDRRSTLRSLREVVMR
jgi:chemotaxis response regulator CheB